MLSPGKRLTVCLFVLSGFPFLQGRTPPSHLTSPPPSPTGKPAAKAKPEPRFEELDLRERRPIQRQLAKGLRHRYRVQMEEGELLHVRVDQDPVKGQEIDVALRVYGPKKQPFPVIDSPTDELGPEEVFLLSDAAGVYRIEVDGLDKRGTYSIRVQSLRPATGADQKTAKAAWLFYHAREIQPKDPAKALQEYMESGHIWRSVGNKKWQARALDRAARISMERNPGDLKSVLDLQMQSLELFREVGARRWTAMLLTAKGITQSRLGKKEEAESCYREAIKISAGQGYVGEEAEALMNLGVLLEQRGDTQQAIGTYKRSFDLWKKRGRTDNQIEVLIFLGIAYFNLGQHPDAMSRYKEAESLLDQNTPVKIRAKLLARISEMYGRMGRSGIELALAYARRALTYRRQAGDVRGEAVSLSGLSLLYQRKDDLNQAKDLQERALAIFRRISDVRAESTARYNLGLTLLHQEDTRQALMQFEQGGLLARRQDYLEGQIGALYGQALAHQKRGNPIAARSAAERALKLIQAGPKVVSSDDDFENPLLQARQGVYELLMDVLVKSPASYTPEEDKARAFEVSDSVRWGLFLESLFPKGRSRLLGEGEGPGEPTTPPAPITLKEAQALLDADTLLLEYFLGNGRSFLLLVTSTTVDVFELPEREEIEAKARQLNGLLLRSRQGSAERQAEELSRDVSQMLLGPAASFLDKKRILVIPDGDIHYVPFSILPKPLRPSASAERISDWGPILLEQHVIVKEPSASVLRALRAAAARRQPPAGFMAVLAAPVFPRGGEYSDLPYSKIEAEQILSLVPEKEKENSLRALGTTANRELVLSGELSQSRYIHFATHGRNDPEHPERSGVVLSQVDSKGRPLEGELSLQDIKNLNLAADLVVLSACKTGLGKEVQGEGFVALPQGFMQAGASRVVVSLWEVNDESTAELMTQFYKALLVEKQTPAEALRTAQLWMRQNRKKWDSPYYWAPFEIQGEWR